MEHKIINLKIFSWVSFFAFVITVSVSGSVRAAGSENWIANLDKGEGSVEFVAVGKPKAIKILGKGDQAKGQLTWEKGKGAGKVTFALASLETGINLRNEHMKKKYLETEKYPDATLVITSIALPSAKAQGDFSVENAPFAGNLSLHGVTKPIQGTATVKRDGNQLQIESGFVIKITDFKIEVPSYMGITVADEVQVQVHSKSPIAIRP